MLAVNPWTHSLRNQPIARYGDSLDAHRVCIFFLPASKIHRAGQRLQHDELRERDLCRLCNVNRCLKSCGLVARQSKDERSKHMDIVLAKESKTLNEMFT